MQLSEIKVLFAEHAQKKNEYHAALKDENSTVGLLNSLKQEMTALDKKLYTLAADLFHKFQNFILKNPEGNQIGCTGIKVNGVERSTQ